MGIGRPFFPEGREAWASGTFRRSAHDGGFTVVEGRSDDFTNIIRDDPPAVPDRPPPPPPLVTHTPTSEPNTAPTATAESTAQDVPSNMGMTILTIAVGCVAAFIIIPALAVVAFLYIRRWRQRGNSTYNSLDDENQEDDDYFSNAPLRQYHDEIQLKDYENESKPSFEETGDLATPVSVIHVIPADLRSPSEGKRSFAIGSGTIRSPGA